MNQLPPNPKIRLDSEIFALITEADKALYKLDGAILALPEKNSILFTLEQREAFFSNRIDSLEYSYQDLFKLSIQEKSNELKKICNYSSSLSLAKKLLRDVSSSSHIIKSIHKELLQEISEGSAGEFRKTQNRVMHYSSNQSEARYVPPKPEEIINLMGELQSYVASNFAYPDIVNAALIHAQFEMIHPFESGNGLVGRILFHIHLLWKKRLSAPILQISKQLYKKKTEYFDRLEDLEKNNNWEAWIKFFIRAAIDGAVNTMDIISKTANLRQSDYDTILNKQFASSPSLKFFDLLFKNPIVSLMFTSKGLELNKQTANVVIAKFLEENIIEEITGQQRNRLFAYKNYLNILE